MSPGPHLFRKLVSVHRRATQFVAGWLRAQWHFRHCSSVGSGARIYGGRALVENHGRITIGRNLTLRSAYTPASFSTGSEGLVRIGDDATINFGVTIHAEQQVWIGDRTQIGQYSLISDVAVPGAPRDAAEKPQPIRIEDDVWITGRVTLLPGAIVGKGSVITAGSIVSGEIPPGVVAGGIPARVIRRIESGADVAGSAPPAPAPAAPSAEAVERKPEWSVSVVADFTADEFTRMLNADPGTPAVAAETAPFGQVIQTLLAGPAADVAMVWTRPQGASSGFLGLLHGQNVGADTIGAEVEQYCEAIKLAAARHRYVFVASWTSPAGEQGGLFAGKSFGTMRALWAMNQKLAELLEPVQNVYVLNAERWLAAAPRGGHSPRGWYLGKVPFEQPVFAAAVDDLKSALHTLKGGARKLLILDLDDTCWGGIVGDMGWENLRLGGHDSEGEAFVDFQKAVKALTRRGIVLGIVSKNEEDVALEAIRRHPEMVLRENDFVGWRINWQDKAQNIADLARELNLGLQSVVFIDDNPIERGRVREALPEVLVPDWPQDKLLYASALRALRCFDVPYITQEDLARTEMYASERERQSLMKSVGSIDEWLLGLDLRVGVDKLRPENLARTVQLLNKTNQLNLTTRRLDEAALLEWVDSPLRTFHVIDVTDRFGEAGLTGIISMEQDGERLRIVDLVLSCRVMGRKVEETLLHLAVADARRRGARSVVATYLPTKKNKPTLSLLERSGFERSGDDFTWNAAGEYGLPAPIRLVMRAGVGS